MTVSGNRLAAAIVLTLALASCASDAEDFGAPQTPIATQVPEAGPPAAIVLSAVGIEVQDVDGNVIEERAFTDDALEVAEMLASAIGLDPKVTEASPDSECGAGTTSFEWFEGEGSLTLTTAPDSVPAPWDTLDLRTGLKAVGALTIATSAGFSIGDNPTELIEKLPEDERDNSAGGFIWERTGTFEAPTGPQAFGGYAFLNSSEDGVTFIGTPGTLSSWFC